MKSIKKFLAIPLSFGATLAMAQMTSFHAINMGLEDPILGTARYTGMAGAMGVLGGNSSSLRDNPAGIGTSTTSDIGLSFNVHTDAEGKASFNMNDASAIFNFNHGKRGYVSTAVAIAYNRVANSGRRIYRFGEIEYKDVDDLGGQYPPTYGTFSDDNVEKGGTGEINIAYAGNVNNMFFFGISLGVVTTDYKQTNLYNKLSDDNWDIFERNYPSPMDYARHTEGAGVNFKAGFIVQPTDFMRAGISIQTPTKVEYDEVWDFYYPLEGKDHSGYSREDYSYEIHHPFKFGGGLAFMIDDRVNIGLDYHARNVGKTWVEYAGRESRSLSSEFSYMGKVEHTAKLGVEVNVVGGLDLRCGFAMVSAPQMEWSDAKQYGMRYRGYDMGMIGLDKKIPNYGVTTALDRKYITGGIGYTGKCFYADFAFSRKLVNEEYTEYIPFTVEESRDIVYEKHKRGYNNYTLSLGFRF